MDERLRQSPQPLQQGEERADDGSGVGDTRHALGMSRLIGQKLNANHGAFLLGLLAYNADTLFQLDAEEKAKEASHKTVRLGLLARQRRFYNTEGRLLCASGQWLSGVAQNERVEALFGFYAPDLAAADP